MSAVQTIESKQCGRLLAESIEKQTPIVLTHRTPEGWRTYRSNMLGGSLAEGALVVQRPIPSRGPMVSLPALQETLGVTFRKGHKKCMFSTVVTDCGRESDDAPFVLRWPREMQQLQRRSYERATPPPGQAIAVRVRPVAEGDGRSQQAWYGELENVSAGGIRVNMPDRAQTEQDGTYQVMFTARPGDEPLIAEATLRHHEAAVHGRCSVGFHFVGLESTEEGQSALARLARIVRDYQRANRSHRH